MFFLVVSGPERGLRCFNYMVLSWVEMYVVLGTIAMISQHSALLVTSVLFQALCHLVMICLRIPLLITDRKLD